MVLTLVFAVALVVVGITLSTRQRDIPTVNQSSSVLRIQTMNVGGVERPRSDVLAGGKRSEELASTQFEFDIESKVEPPADAVFPYGRTPLVDPATNASTQMVFDILQSKDAERIDQLSPYAQIEPFDLDKYRANPSDYLAQIVPARVWQAAQPGEGVPRLAAVSSQHLEMVQGEAVQLQVKTAPHSPATFYAFDLGAFQNSLPVITVESDDNGVATAIYTSTPGTINLSRVLASSPTASGNKEFDILISLP